jgi:hypothetical protein
MFQAQIGRARVSRACETQPVPKACFPLANFFARSEFFIVKIEKNLLKI